MTTEQDEMVEVTVSVTQEDIHAGVANNCKKCPIALAASRSIGRPVEIYCGGIFCLCGKGRWWADLPLIANDFVNDFDDGCYPVSPFTFLVSVPKGWLHDN